MNTLEPKLESLLMSKAFETLNAEERLYVSDFLTEEKYNAYHLILKYTLSGTQEADNTLLPAAEIPAKLKTHFNATRKPTSGFGLTIKQLSIAASLLVAISLGVIWFKADKLDKTQFISEQTKINLPNVKPELKERPIDLSEKPLEQKLASNVKTTQKLKAVEQVNHVENTDVVVMPEELYGLHVQEPLLGLDIDVNDQLLGLHTSANTN